MSQPPQHRPPLAAHFVKSSTEPAQLPPPDLPEFAFIGRSNVGKSSLINALVQRKGLAKVSATPGKTRQINHFRVGERWYLVDLPGYGYAKVSKTERAAFEQMIWRYLRQRESLMVLFVLVDARHEPLAIDREFLDGCGRFGIPFALVLTKADKLTRNQQQAATAAWQRALAAQWEPLPPMFLTSADTGAGRDALLDYVDSLTG